MLFRSNKSLQKIIHELENSSNKTSEITDQLFPNQSVEESTLINKLLNHQELSTINLDLVRPLSARITDLFQFSNRPLPSMNHWIQLLSLTRQIVNSGKSINPTALQQVQFILSSQYANIQDSRNNIHLLRDDILYKMLEQIKTNQNIFSRFMKDLWEESVLATAEELKSKGFYEKPPISMDMRLCNLQESFASGQQSEQLKSFIQEKLDHRDRLRLFFSPKTELVNHQMQPIGNIDPNGAGVKACLMVDPSGDPRVIASGIFKSYYDHIQHSCLRSSRGDKCQYDGFWAFAIEKGFCSVTYPVTLKLRISNADSLQERYWKMSGQYFYNYIADTVPVDASSLPYAQKYSDLNWSQKDRSMTLKELEFNRRDSDSWVTARIRTRTQELAEVACRSKLPTERDISREQRFINALLQLPTTAQVNNKENYSPLIIGLRDKNIHTVDPRSVETIYSNDPKQRVENLKRFIDKFAPLPKSTLSESNILSRDSLNLTLQNEWNLFGIKMGVQNFNPNFGSSVLTQNKQENDSYNLVDPVLVQFFYAKTTDFFLRKLVTLLLNQGDPEDPKMRLPEVVRKALDQSEYLSRMIPITLAFLYDKDPRIISKLDQLKSNVLLSRNYILSLGFQFLLQKNWKINLQEIKLEEEPLKNSQVSFEVILANKFLKDNSSARRLSQDSVSQRI